MTFFSRKITHQRADYLGMYSSGLCLIHCLGLPLVLALFSVNHVEYYWLNIVFLLGCIVAVSFSIKHQEYTLIKISFYFFLTLLSIALIFEGWYHWLEILSYVASIGLILTHASSIHFCKKCAENPTITNS